MCIRDSQLTGLMQDQLHAEYEEIMKQIAYLESILADDEVCRKVMKDELLEVKAKYGDERRSEIVDVYKRQLTASPKSPSFMINCFLLYTSEAIQRKGTKSLSKSPLHAAVARAYRSTKTRFI